MFCVRNDGIETGLYNMKKVLFVITQFYKGGAEVALLNLFKQLPRDEVKVDFLIFDQMILKDAQSLIPQVPEWINVCDAAAKEGQLAIIRKVLFKVYRKITKRQLYRKSAYDFVKNKKYDIAFSYGEWMAPEFVARKVNAEKKYVWIHADIDKAGYVDEKVLFGYDKSYSGYIFVSEQSCADAVKAFPILSGRTHIIHNMCDDELIRKLAKEIPEEEEHYRSPWLLSVANLREEKNYPRMVETMRCLRDKGLDIRWLCVGSTANPFQLNKIQTLLDKYQLKDRFILLGTKKNPYMYMARSAAVVVLSDFEAWSLVITEAKLLGIPVITTRTSGAIEQIEEGKTGIFVPFEPEQIANKIEEFLNNDTLSKQIHDNLEGFSTNQRTLSEFYRVLGE